MNWTHEKPTEPGCYIARSGDGIALGRLSANPNGDGLVSAFERIAPGLWHESAWEESWLWFGPIPEPPTEERNG